MSEKGKQRSTMAALLEEKPKRGRPQRTVKRQNVYVSLSPEQKQEIKSLGTGLPEGLVRADVADLAVAALTAKLEALRQAVAGRRREIPEGITDLESLYLLWDLPLPVDWPGRRWTSIRLSPQEAIELGRAQGTLNAAFGANRSQTFELALALLTRFLEENPPSSPITLAELRAKIFDMLMSSS